MDAELLRQRAAFQKHAAATVSVTHKSEQSSSNFSTYNAEQVKKKKKKKTHNKEEASKALGDIAEQIDYTSPTALANSANFSTMAKIVDYMKKRLLTQQQWALSLQEILDELQIYDLTKKSEQWLRDALPRNPRLQVDADGKFTFKPPYKVKNKHTLLKVLEKHHIDAKGGILLSELAECIPNPDKVVESLGPQVVSVNTQVNKRKDRVIFFNDSATDFDMQEDFKSLWRNISVAHLDEKKIEEYLVKHGIDTMRDLAPKRNAAAPPKRKAAKRRLNQKVHNEHLEDVLEDYQ